MSVEVIDFHAEWCGPCKQQHPILDELDEEYEDVEFTHIDIEEEIETVREYNIQTVPTLVVLDDGEVQEQMMGFQQKGTIEEKLTPFI